MDFDQAYTKNLISRFSAMMLDRMVSHAEKGGWDRRATATFQTGFLRKQLEISTAIEAEDWPRVGLACVDMANFAMMLADRVAGIDTDGGLSPTDDPQ